MQTELGPLAVTGVGMATQYGASRDATLSRLADAPSAYMRMRHFIGTDYRPQLGAFVEELPQGKQAALRIRQLAKDAIADLMSTRSFAPDARGFTLALLLPEPTAEEGLPPDALTAIATTIGDDLAATTGLRPDNFTIHPSGPPALVEAVRGHAKTLEIGSALMIVGADSLACRARLSARASAGRLFSSRHPYAPIPGEAGAAILLEPAPDCMPLAMIQGIGLVHDPIGELDDGHSSYAAQSDAANDALTRLDKSTGIGHVLTDWSNGRFRASELAHTELRLQKRLSETSEVSHIPITFGDVGAATMALGIPLAMDKEGQHLILGSGLFNKNRAALHLSVPATPAT